MGREWDFNFTWISSLKKKNSDLTLSRLVPLLIMFIFLKNTKNHSPPNKLPLLTCFFAPSPRRHVSEKWFGWPAVFCRGESFCRAGLLGCIVWTRSEIFGCPRIGEAGSAGPLFSRVPGG